MEQGKKYTVITGASSGIGYEAAKAFAERGKNSFIKRLKETGMPIKEIKKYAVLRAKGDDTLSERMECWYSIAPAVQRISKP